MARTSDSSPPPFPAGKPATADTARWTGAKASAFLKALARSGKVGPCAAQVGMSRQAAYRLRARAPEFAKFWDMAIEEAARSKAAKVRARRGAGVHPLLARQRAKPFAGEPPEGDSSGPKR